MTISSEAQGTPNIHFAVHGVEGSGQAWTNITQTLRGKNVIWMPNWCTWRGQYLGHVIFAAVLKDAGTDLQIFSNRLRQSEDDRNTGTELNLAGLVLREEMLGQGQTFGEGNDQIYDIGSGTFDVDAINTRCPAVLRAFVTKLELPSEQTGYLHLLQEPANRFAVAA